MTEGDEEHKEFEMYGRLKGLDMTMHPMFLLYLNDETADELEEFKIDYAKRKVDIAT